MKHPRQRQQNNLKAYRVKHSFTQNEVASLLGFHTNERISKWEKGVKNPNLVNLFRLCKIYEASPSDLYPDLNS